MIRRRMRRRRRGKGEKEGLGGGEGLCGWMGVKKAWFGLAWSGLGWLTREAAKRPCVAGGGANAQLVAAHTTAGRKGRVQRC